MLVKWGGPEWYQSDLHCCEFRTKPVWRIECFQHILCLAEVIYER
jgi:hypothetical protein